MLWPLGLLHVEPANTKIFRIEVTWHTIRNIISLNINFHLIYLLSKALLHHIDDATSLSKKTLYII